MKTKVIGQQFVELISVDSTNKYAAEQLALSKLRHGAVIMAHEQTMGRGQRGRAWLSANGLDLTFSIVLMPERLKAGDQFILAKVAALTVMDVVQDELRLSAGLGGGEVRVKWPNDVLIGRRKIAGILIKNEIVGGLVQNCIVGIGLNVNSSDLNADLNATSLRMETGQQIDRFDLLERILEGFEWRWERWEKGEEHYAEAYAKALWMRGRFAEFLLDDQPVSARPVDVDAEGRLIVDLEDGTTKAFGLDRLRFQPR